MKVIVSLLISYNIIFIPLQYAYRIPFSPGLIFVDVLTMLVYIIDLGFRIKSLFLLYERKGNIPESGN